MAILFLRDCNSRKNMLLDSFIFDVLGDRYITRQLTSSRYVSSEQKNTKLTIRLFRNTVGRYCII